MASETSSPVAGGGEENSFVGSLISLISKSEIRYEGILYNLDTSNSTLALTNVKSYGTEGRRKGGTEVPPSDNVYEYILFRGSDIKDLQVKSSPPAKLDVYTHNDPAIIQSHLAPPSSISKSAPVGVPHTESSNYQRPYPVTSRVQTDTLSLNNSVSLGGQSFSQASQLAAVPSSEMLTFWQGYNGTSIKIADTLQHPVAVSAPTYPSALQASAMTGLANSFNRVTPLYSHLGPSSSNQNFPSAFNPNHSSVLSTEPPASMSLKPPVTSHSMSLSARQTMPSPFQDVNIAQGPFSGTSVFHSASSNFNQTVPHSVPSTLGTASGPLLNPVQTSSGLNTPAQSGLPLRSTPQDTYVDQRGVGSLTSSTAFTNPMLQAPLLPLPLAAQQPRYSTPQFTEEFDFEAMNEKFKKDEVWGYLGKVKQNENRGGLEGNAGGQSTGDVKSAYQKDDFFDTISCNSHTRGGRTSQNRFPGRSRMNYQSFGSFQQRPPGGYRNYGPEPDENYRGSYNWGRGSGYRPF